MDIQLLLAFISFTILAIGSCSIINDSDKEELFRKAYNCYKRLEIDYRPELYQEMRSYAEKLDELNCLGDAKGAESIQVTIALAASLVLDDYSFLVFVPKVSLSLKEPMGWFYLRDSLIPEISKRYDENFKQKSPLKDIIAKLYVAFDSVCIFLKKVKLQNDDAYGLNDLFEINNALDNALRNLKQYSNQGLNKEIYQEQCSYRDKLNQKLEKELQRLKEMLTSANVLFGQEKMLNETLEGQTNRIIFRIKKSCSRRVLSECKELAKQLVRTGSTTLPVLLKREPASFRVAFLLCLTNENNEEVFLDQRIYNLLLSRSSMSRVDLFPVVGLAVDKMLENLGSEKILFGSIDEVISLIFKEKSANL